MFLLNKNQHWKEEKKTKIKEIKIELFTTGSKE
jgi:hypothetical protein